MSLRAKYRIEKETAEFLIIRDVGAADGHTTVTNDAEAVVADLLTCGAVQGQRIIYIDSEGDCDEILVEDGKFVGFAPLYAWASFGDAPARKVQVKSITGWLDVPIRLEPDERPSLLYRMARHLRQTDGLHPIKWGTKSIELLAELRELDPEKYDRLVK